MNTFSKWSKVRIVAFVYEKIHTETEESILCIQTSINTYNVNTSDL